MKSLSSIWVQNVNTVHLSYSSQASCHTVLNKKNILPKCTALVNINEKRESSFSAFSFLFNTYLSLEMFPRFKIEQSFISYLFIF